MGNCARIAALVAASSLINDGSNPEDAAAGAVVNEVVNAPSALEGLSAAVDTGSVVNVVGVD